MNLDDFIAYAQPRLESGFPSNSDVVEAGFERLYVRMTRRYINGKVLDPVLDIANLEVVPNQRGRGLFTIMVRILRERHPKLHIYVENVLMRRFQSHLVAIGFRRVERNPPDLIPSFILEAP